MFRQFIFLFISSKEHSFLFMKSNKFNLKYKAECFYKNLSYVTDLMSTNLTRMIYGIGFCRDR